MLDTAGWYRHYTILTTYSVIECKDLSVTINAYVYSYISVYLQSDFWCPHLDYGGAHFPWNCNKLHDIFIYIQHRIGKNGHSCV